MRTRLPHLSSSQIKALPPCSEPGPLRETRSSKRPHRSHHPHSTKLPVPKKALVTPRVCTGCHGHDMLGSSTRAPFCSHVKGMAEGTHEASRGGTGRKQVNCPGGPLATPVDPGQQLARNLHPVGFISKLRTMVSSAPQKDALRRDCGASGSLRHEVALSSRVRKDTPFRTSPKRASNFLTGAT